MNIADILNKEHVGYIVDIADPKFLGRVRVDLRGIFSSVDGSSSIDFSKSAWFYPETPNQDTFFTPKKGNRVLCTFDGDVYHGRYRSYEGISDNMIKKLKEDYEGYKSIVFDEEEKLEIFYSRKLGVNIKYNDSLINITKDGKNIIASVDGGKRSFELDHDSFSVISDKISNGKKGKSDEPSVLGNKQVDQLDLIWEAINKLNDDFSDYTKLQGLVSVGILSPLKAGNRVANASTKTNSKKISSGKGKVKTILSKVNTLD